MIPTLAVLGLGLLGLVLVGVLVDRRFTETKERLHASEARFAGIIDVANEAIISVDANQRVIVFNRGARRIFGYTEEEIVGESVERLIPSSLGQAHNPPTGESEESSGAARPTGQPRVVVGIRQNGEHFPAEASIARLDLGHESIFTVVLTDISRRQKTELALRQFMGTLDRTLDCVFIFDPRTLKFSYVNQGAINQVGYEKHELLEMTPLDIKPEFDESTFRARIAPLLNGEKPSLTFQTVHRHKNGNDIPVEIILQYIAPSGEDPRFVAIVRDITERRRSEEALAEQAIRDSLTGLYNRRHFNVRITHEIARAARVQYTMAVLICDLDGFKAVNDTHGHLAGDEVLVMVAQALLESTRGSDLVFRLGGDEFVILLPNSTREALIPVADRIRARIAEVGAARGHVLDMSIGVALYPEHGTDPMALLRAADQALYIAKKGGAKIQIGAEEYELNERLVAVVFQPVVDLQTNGTIGYEALSRDAEDRYSVLDLFKRYHRVGKLRELKCLCFGLQLRAAQQARLERVFLNVDFTMLESLDIPPLPAGMSVVLEISEAEIMHHVDAHMTIAQKWKRAGYQFAMDDFGAGFVSLPFLARLIPDYIKLDRSTVVQAVSSDEFRAVLQDLIHALQRISTYGIIAEGVETEKELRVMKGLGISLVQGYLFGKPAPLQ